MYYTWNILFNHSIAAAAVIALFRYRHILPIYYPFVWFLCLGFVQETISLLLIINNHYNAYTGNIYVLVEFILLLWQFRRWLYERKRLCWALMIIGLLVWITDNFIVSNLGSSNSLFRIYYAFVVTCLGIEVLNNIVFLYPGRIIRYARFIIALAFVVFYCYKTFLEVFNLFELHLQQDFYMRLWLTMAIINFMTNITYAIAVLCIPTKEDFSIQYYSR